MFHFSKQISTARQNAFTLVELLVVIAIIGILASLAAVGVMKSLEKAKFVAAKMEISQLEVAIAAAKQSFGNVDELPSVLELYSSGVNFQTAAINNVTVDTKNTFNFLTKAFGKSWYTQTNLPWLGSSTNVASYSNSPKRLVGMEALVFLLGGYVDSSSGKPSFLGFSSNPLNPMDVTNTKYKTKGPFYEFEASRIKQGSVGYTMVNSWDGPYVYFSNSYYNFGAVSNGTAFYNLKTFQIISSGPDQVFGTGIHAPGTIRTTDTTHYGIGGTGYDDLANFSSTQLGKKDE